MATSSKAGRGGKSRKGKASKKSSSARKGGSSKKAGRTSSKKSSKKSSAVRFKPGKELRARGAKKGARKGPTARSASKKKSTPKPSAARKTNALKRANRVAAVAVSPSPIERVKRVVSSVGSQGMDAARHFGENVMHAGEAVVDRVRPMIPGQS